MRRTDLPTDESEQWEWARNPLPPKAEHETRDPETGEPLLKRIKVELLGEGPDEAIPLPGY
jgi:hypothetical protein